MISKFSPEITEAYKNTKIFNFAFGTPLWMKEVHVCPTCGKTITDFQEVQFLQENQECLDCDTIRTCDSPEEFFTGVFEYEEKLQYA